MTKLDKNHKIQTKNLFHGKNLTKKCPSTNEKPHLLYGNLIIQHYFRTTWTLSEKDFILLTAWISTENICTTLIWGCFPSVTFPCFSCWNNRQNQWTNKEKKHKKSLDSTTAKIFIINKNFSHNILFVIKKTSIFLLFFFLLFSHFPDFF